MKLHFNTRIISSSPRVPRCPNGLPLGFNDGIRQSCAVHPSADSYILIAMGNTSDNMCPQRVWLSLKLCMEVDFGEVPLYTVSFQCNPGNHFSLGKKCYPTLIRCKSETQQLLHFTFPLHKSSISSKSMARTAVRSPLLLLPRAAVSGPGCKTLAHRHCTGNWGSAFFHAATAQILLRKSNAGLSRVVFLANANLGNLTRSLPRRALKSPGTPSPWDGIGSEQGWSKAGWW